MIFIAKQQREDPLTELKKAYAHWQQLYDHGGSDPTWPDGVNLNLVRNHIYYYKRQIEENFPLYMSHELYQRELPPEVDNNYMTRSDEIREHARQSLQAYLADPDYRYLLRHKDNLSPRLRKELCIENVLGYVRGLKTALEKDNLVAMRLHERADFYLDSFKDCADKVRQALEDEVPHLFEPIPICVKTDLCPGEIFNPIKTVDLKIRNEALQNLV